MPEPSASKTRWPAQSPASLHTIACRLCGAIIGLRYGTAGNPTDGVDKHVEWHRKHGEEGV